MEVLGARNGTRTRDPDLGKVVLYQLSYSRMRASNIRRQVFTCQVLFRLTVEMAQPANHRPTGAGLALPRKPGSRHVTRDNTHEL